MRRNGINQILQQLEACVGSLEAHYTHNKMDKFII